MRVYKVVKKRKGELFSAVVMGRVEVEYKKGVWATPPRWLEEEGYLLTAFRSLEQAVKFKNLNKEIGWELEIWEAEGEDGHITVPPLNVYLLEQGEFFSEGDILSWPEGTIFMKKLRLLKKVEGV